MEQKTTNEYVMYIIINQDLKMKKGKIAAQACHGSCGVVRFLERVKHTPGYYDKWINNHVPKVVLKTSYENIVKLKNEHMCPKDINYFWCIPVYDLGKTQIAPNSLTVLAFRPILKKDCPDFIKNLKLL